MLWLTSAAFQLAAFMNPGTPKYNGVRLFLSVFPFLCLFAGVGFDWLAGKAAGYVRAIDVRSAIRQPAAKVAAALMLLALLPGAYDTLDSHPFGMSFYNAAVGGVQGAEQRGFEPTYWGDAFLPTLSYLSRHAPENAVVCVIPGTVDWLFKYYKDLGLLRADIQIANSEQSDFDLVVFHARQSEMTTLARRLLKRRRFRFEVRYAGVTLAAVADREAAMRAQKAVRVRP
jgi:hypothetical protein